MFEDFFTNERDKGFLAHVDIVRALGSQIGNLFAYPSANLLVVFGSHSFNWGELGEKETYARSRPNFYLDNAVVNFWLRQLIVLLGLTCGNRSAS
jgi:hypothetical protein